MKIPPSIKTYGLSDLQYAEIWTRQDGNCPICGEGLEDRGTHIDHDHRVGGSATKKFRKTSLEDRRKSVRGILHSHCNWQVLRHVNLKQAKAIVKYLRGFERRPK